MFPGKQMGVRSMRLPTLPRGTFGRIPAKTRRSLEASLVDGWLWALMYGLGEMYVVPFALHFGASALLVSLVTGLGQMSVSLASVAGAHFIQGYRRRRRLAVAMNLLQAATYLPLFWMTVATKDPDMVVVFFVAGVAAAAFAGSAWFSWMNDLVPADLRGRFWGFRTRSINLVQMAAGLLGGAVLNVAQGAGRTLWGFGVLFMAAAVFRAASVWPLLRQHEPPMRPAPEGARLSFAEFALSLTRTNIGRFTLFNVLFMFATGMVPAITTMFLLRTLRVSYLEMSVVNTAFTLSTALLMTYWGRLTDLYGNRQVFSFTAVGILLIPVGWMVLRSVPALVLLNLLSGFFWSGFALSAQNFVVDNTDRRTLHYHIAYFNAANNFAAFLGALAGGILARNIQALPWDRVGFVRLTDLRLEVVFFVSFLLRLAVVLLWGGSFREVRRRRPVSHPLRAFVVAPALERLEALKMVPSAAAEGYGRWLRALRRMLRAPSAAGREPGGSSRRSRRRSGPRRPWSGRSA